MTRSRRTRIHPAPTASRRARLLSALIAVTALPAWAGSATITPPVHDFGDVTVGQLGATQLFTFANPTTDPMTITSAGLGGAAPTQYSVTSNTCAGAAIPPAGLCTLGVRFNPGAVGTQVALVRIAYSAPPPAPPGGAEINATLIGNGVAAPVAVAQPVPGPGWVALLALAALCLGAAVRGLRRTA